MGYFLRAKLLVGQMLEKQKTGSKKAAIKYTHTVLCHHNSHAQRSDWNSLPELTNKDGKVGKREK